jgi:hypothetical protein
MRKLTDTLQNATPAPPQDTTHAAAAALTGALAASDSCAPAGTTLRSHIKTMTGELTRMDQERAKQAKAQSDRALQRLLAKQPRQGHRKILAPSGTAMPALHALQDQQGHVHTDPDSMQGLTHKYFSSKLAAPRIKRGRYLP